MQLSRKLIPGLSSYSLGKLCKALNIENTARHRAGGDAFATMQLFKYLLNISKNKDLNSNVLDVVDKKNIHPQLSLDKLNNLPEEPGVYYFFNDKHELIYIGKSKNIRNRILSHLRNNDTKKAIEMKNEIADIDFELTGSELIALLKESHEIKQYKPLYNRSQRRSLSQYGLYHYIDTNGYLCFFLARLSERNEMPVSCFSTLRTAKSYLQNLVDEYELCNKLCGIFPSPGACFHYKIKECKGACIGAESPEDYNLRAEKILKKHRLKHKSFYIIDSGRNPDESAIIKIENGKYIGFGYSGNFYESDISELGDCIKAYDDNRDTQQIIRNFISKNQGLNIIES